jgi:hypothetical protein
MNEAIPLDAVWFKSEKGTVGIVKVQTIGNGIEYRISAVDGLLEKMDVLQVVAWGARFPDAAGKALMRGKK